MPPLALLPGLWLFDPAGPLPTCVTVDEAGRWACSCCDEGERQGCEHLEIVRRLAA